MENRPFLWASRNIPAGPEGPPPHFLTQEMHLGIVLEYKIPKPCYRCCVCTHVHACMHAHAHMHDHVHVHTQPLCTLMCSVNAPPRALWLEAKPQLHWLTCPLGRDPDGAGICLKCGWEYSDTLVQLCTALLLCMGRKTQEGGITRPSLATLGEGGRRMPQRNKCNLLLNLPSSSVCFECHPLLTKM